MKNFTQLLTGREGSKAKTDSTSCLVGERVKPSIGTTGIRSTSLFGIILTLLLTLGTGQMWADVWYLYGDMTAWSSKGNNKLVDEGSNIYSVYCSMTASTTYTFKVYNNNGWDSSRAANNASATVTIGTWYQTWGNYDEGNKGNMSVTPTETGLYKFEYNSSNTKVCFTKVAPSAAAPNSVVTGTNVMFYIQGYDSGDYNYLVNSTPTKASTTYPLNYEYSYVSIAKTNLATYDRITNNFSSWNGTENTAPTWSWFFDEKKFK